MAFPKELLTQREELDRKLKTVKSILGDGRLEEGVKYARWLVMDGLMATQMAAEIGQTIKSDQFFVGTICGKPLTIFFFLPEFD